MPSARRPGASKRKASRSVEELGWLAGQPALDALIERYPQEWLLAKLDVEALLARDDAEEIKNSLLNASHATTQRPGGQLRPAHEQIRTEVRRQMSRHLLRRAVLRSTTGIHEGRIRFSLVNGYVAQKLLFRRDLERKAVSLWLFRLAWPLLRQRRILMPLVQSRGIWCFYSKPLITRLAKLIGGRPCLEIAAGDGTLTRLLADANVNITATDNHSWTENINFPDFVLKQDACTALNRHRPEVVICSWPPAGNSFEQHVFRTSSVQLYIVIGSASEHSTGNWTAYRQQVGFDHIEDSGLSRLLVPPEVQHAVHLFRRR